MKNNKQRVPEVLDDDVKNIKARDFSKVSNLTMFLIGTLLAQIVSQKDSVRDPADRAREAFLGCKILPASMAHFYGGLLLTLRIFQASEQEKITIFFPELLPTFAAVRVMGQGSILSDSLIQVAAQVVGSREILDSHSEAINSMRKDPFTLAQTIENLFDALNKPSGRSFLMSHPSPKF